MISFSQLNEDKAGKNLHLEHLEDEIINNGVPGGRAAINFLRIRRRDDRVQTRSKVVVRDGKDVIAPKVHAIVRIVLHPIRAALFRIIITRTIIKSERVSERVRESNKNVSACKCHLPFKSSRIFFFFLI